MVRRAAMRDYSSIPELADVYLEDSWVLSISAQPGLLVLVIDVERHPAYRTPAADEQYCYRRGILRFDRLVAVSFRRQPRRSRVRCAR